MNKLILTSTLFGALTLLISCGSFDPNDAENTDGSSYDAVFNTFGGDQTQTGSVPEHERAVFAAANKCLSGDAAGAAEAKTLVQAGRTSGTEARALAATPNFKLLIQAILYLKHYTGTVKDVAVECVECLRDIRTHEEESST